MSAADWISRHAPHAWWGGGVRRRRMRAPAAWILCTALAMGSCAARSRPIFQGHWRVVLFTAPGISTLGPTDAADWIGTVAIYEAHRAVFGRETCAEPKYATRTMTPDEFVAEYRVRPADVGLSDDSVTQITVTCSSAWTNRGSVLLVKSRDALLTMWDGVFFELERRIP